MFSFEFKSDIYRSAYQRKTNEGNTLFIVHRSLIRAYSSGREAEAVLVEERNCGVECRGRELREPRVLRVLRLERAGARVKLVAAAVDRRECQHRELADAIGVAVARIFAPVEAHESAPGARCAPTRGVAERIDVRLGGLAPVRLVQRLPRTFHQTRLLHLRLRHLFTRPRRRRVLPVLSGAVNGSRDAGIARIIDGKRGRLAGRERGRTREVANADMVLVHGELVQRAQSVARDQHAS